MFDYIENKMQGAFMNTTLYLPLLLAIIVSLHQIKADEISSKVSDGMPTAAEIAPVKNKEATALTEQEDVEPTVAAPEVVEPTNATQKEEPAVVRTNEKPIQAVPVKKDAISKPTQVTQPVQEAANPAQDEEESENIMPEVEDIEVSETEIEIPVPAEKSTAESKTETAKKEGEMPKADEPSSEEESEPSEDEPSSDEEE